MSMNISQLFVTKRPIAWTAMISVLVWGVYAYLMMPQRQDPIIPVVTGVIITPYPGAEAEKVEQEVTRKIERKVAENPAVEHVKSISRPGMSIVYVDCSRPSGTPNSSGRTFAESLARSRTCRSPPAGRPSRS